MVFSDQSFLFLFLPLAIAAYYAARIVGGALLVIFVSSIVFFYWSSGSYTLLLLISILINYVSGLLISRARQKRVLVLSIVLNLSILFYFKYAGFAFDVIDSALGRTGPNPLSDIVLPIGISFYTFQGLSYVFDVWKGEIRSDRNFLRFAAYLSFFPQLIAGPIVRYKTVAEDFAAPKVSAELFAAGAARFLVGLLKKVLVADTVALVANAAFAGQDPGFAEAWLGALAYAIQIYFDFSGYSDMAIGLGMMFGIRFAENFNHPYAASTITAFWRRWHISLSTWFRDYLYIPLGGNRAGTARTYVNLFIVFFATGLWHGAAWTFVIWGLSHGAFLVLERVLLGKRAATAGNQVSRLFYALPALAFTWVIFRADDFADTTHRWLAMLSPLDAGAFSLSRQVAISLTPETLLVLAGAGLVVLAQPWLTPLGVIAARTDLSVAARFGRLAGVALAGSVALVWVLSSHFSPFLYFRF